MGTIAHIGARVTLFVARYSDRPRSSKVEQFPIFTFPTVPHPFWGLHLRTLYTWRYRRRTEASHTHAIGVDPPNGTSALKARGKAPLLLRNLKTALRVVRSSRQSKTQLKRIRLPPSRRLITTLLDLNCHDAVPDLYPNRLDWSRDKPTSAGTGRLERSRLKKGTLPSRTLGHLSESAAKTLPYILTNYLEHISPLLNAAVGHRDTDVTLDNAILDVFPAKVLTLLEGKGYHPEDVVTWAWITMAADAERATLRLSMASISRTADGNPPRPVPTFVFLFLLRRKHINARTLRMLLVYAWSALRGAQPTPSSLFPAVQSDQGAGSRLQTCQSPNGASFPKLNETTIVTMVIRLLRHARQVWIQAIVSIAEMIVSYVDGTGGQGQMGDLNPVTVARLTMIYNRILSQLSLPSKIGPFLSVPHYQRAQFNLIERMGQFKPPLPITQEGYRAVVKVQLAHKKTLPERRWSEKQAKSWPPWKEEKLGIDAEASPNEGMSRAVEALNRMREAGYKGDSWEDVAAIYAGWDTDGSPTIQTRTIMRRGLVGRKPLASRDSKNHQPSEHSHSDHEVQDVWAARIRATRTIQEAWACFLVHEDLRLPLTPDIYEAMFEKLVFEKIRVKKDRWKRPDCEPNPARVSQPGDGKEVCPAPINPNEAIYIRSEPPELVDLFDRMIREGMQPSERCLAFLVSHADSPALGVRFLRSSGLLRAQSLRVLTDLGMSTSTQYESQDWALREIPERIFAAFISLLCRLPTPILCSRAVITTLDCLIPWEEKVEYSIDTEVSPLVKAYDLVYARRPQGRPAWNALLAALARSGVSFGSSHGRAPRALLQDLVSWKLMGDAVREMRTSNIEMDSQSLQILCVGLEKAVLSCLELKAGLSAGHEGCILPRSHPLVQRGNSRFVQLDSEAEHLLNTGAAYIKSSFASLVGHDAHVDPRLPTVIDHLAEGIEDPPRIVMPTLSPPLLSVPNPALIHAYIRVLGLLQDYQGLLTLTRWMATFADELHAVTKELHNGTRLQRRCLIALRVFLERSWDIKEVGEEDDLTASPGAPEEIITQVRDIVTDMEYWGTWPEDDEVELYCRGRRLL